MSTEPGVPFIDRRVGERRAHPHGTPDRRRGRPPRVAGEKTNIRQEFLLTASERRALRAVARETGQSIATLVREAVNEFVADFAEKRIFLRK